MAKLPDAKTILRLGLVLVLLGYLYIAGMHLEIIAILGIVFLGFILLRGRIWKAAEKSIELHLPFTKKWSEWAHKAVVLILFIVIYIILKQIIYILLGLAGIDIEQIIIDSFRAGTA